MVLSGSLADFAAAATDLSPKFTDLRPGFNRAVQRTAAPMGSRMVRVILSATVADDRAFPVVVAELGCHAAIV